MDKNAVTPEELAAEQAALAESKEVEIREKIVAEFGFDEVDDFERIDKLVAKELSHREKLSSAIGQKIKHRAEADELRKKVINTSGQVNKIDADEVEKVVQGSLEKRDLDSLDYPTELKNEIKRIAQAQNVSIKQAARDPYIVFKIGEHEKTQRAEEAAISRTNKSSGKKTFSFENPPEVDMATEEGRKEWEAWKLEMTKQGN